MSTPKSDLYDKELEQVLIFASEVATAAKYDGDARNADSLDSRARGAWQVITREHAALNDPYYRHEFFEAVRKQAS